MADDPHSRRLTRHGVLLGVAAVAANALVAACGSNVPVTPAATAIPAAGTRLAPSLPTTTQPTATPAPFVVPTVGRTLDATTSAPTTPLIAFLGAAFAVASPNIPRTETLPAQTMALLAPARYDAVDLTVAGDTLDRLNTRASWAIDPLYAASRRKNILVFSSGINDLYNGRTVAETFAKMVMVGQARRQVGWKIVWLTLIPSWDMASTVEDYVIQRQAINALMRANRASFADALADVGADATMGVEGIEADRAYYQSDGWQLTAEGYRIMAGYVTQAIRTL